MAEPALIGESVRLMFVGMGIVFAFLFLLVGVLRLMSWAIARFAPPAHEPAPLPAGAPVGWGASRPGDPGDDLIAVLGAAVARYRAGRRR